MHAICAALRESLANTPDHGHRVLVSPTVGLIFFCAHLTPLTLLSASALRRGSVTAPNSNKDNIMPRNSKTGVRGLYKKNDRFNIDIRYRDPSTGRNHRYVERLPPGISLAAAKERTRKLLNTAIDGSLIKSIVGQTSAAPKLFERLDDYLAWCAQNRPKTQRDRRHLVGLIKKHCANSSLESIDGKFIETFKRARANDGVKPATINRALAMFKHFLSRATVEQWLPEAVGHSARKSIALLKEPPGRSRDLSADEKQRLLAALPLAVRELVVFALLTGMRRGEIINLKKSEIDLARREARLTETKNNRARTVPLHPSLLPIVDRAIKRSSSDLVFATEHGHPMKYATTELFRRIRKQLGIKDFRFHDLRHDFATSLRRQGNQLDIIAKLLGHTTLAMTQRYSHIGQSDLRKAVEALLG